jgi:hypothetical protein
LPLATRLSYSPTLSMKSRANPSALYPSIPVVNLNP